MSDKIIHVINDLGGKTNITESNNVKGCKFRH